MTILEKLEKFMYLVILFGPVAFIAMAGLLFGQTLAVDPSRVGEVIYPCLTMAGISLVLYIIRNNLSSKDWERSRELDEKEQEDHRQRILDQGQKADEKFRKQEMALEGKRLSLIERILFAVASSDGRLHENELILIDEYFRHQLGQNYTDKRTLKNRYNLYIQHNNDIAHEINANREHLTHDFSMHALRTAITLAICDGELATEEAHILHVISRALGIDDKTLDKTVKDTTSSILNPVN